MIPKGLYFGDVHTYDDLGLILSVCDIPPAKPKTTYVNVPGADGSVDLTEAHGEVKFSDRECSFTFTMLPDESFTWEEKKTEVSNLVHGKVFKITLDKDEDYFYEGRCVVSDVKSDKNLKQIVVNATVKPYKFKQNVTRVEIPLTDVPKTATVANGRKSVIPLITCTNDNTVIVFGDSTFNLSAGTHKVLDIQFVMGSNTVTVSGKGSVTFLYQEGDL